MKSHVGAKESKTKEVPSLQAESLEANIGATIHIARQWQ
jgi:hypothetical protein